MIYFDHAATTPPYDDVISTVAEIMKLHYGNPSSLHKWGEESAKLLGMARAVCAEALGVRSSEIIFTSSATESNNLAIKGAAIEYRSRGKHIITTSIEHPSVFECCEQLKKLGYELTILPVDEFGRVSLQQVEQAVRKDTILVSIMHVNNETGSIQPVEEIGQMLKRQHPRVLFHVDGVQGLGKVPLKLTSSGIDLYSVSAHKIRGPKGSGLLYVRNGIKLFPLLAGGGQEGGMRSGTENVPNIVGMAKALRLTMEGMPERTEHLTKYRQMLMKGIEEIPGLVMNTPTEGAPHIINFSFPGMKSEVFLHSLEQKGILVSTKSACSSKRTEPSRILTAMGKGANIASSAIRISLGEEHTAQDIEALLSSVQLTVNELSRFKEGVNGEL